MSNTIWGDFARISYNVDVEIEGQEYGAAIPPTPPRNGGGAARNIQYSGGTLEDQPSAYGGEGYAAADAEDPGIAAAPVTQRKLEESEQLGRNDPCWCGSGKKFKKCHGA